MRGPSIDSDHFLVKAVVKQKFSVIYKKKLKPSLIWNMINLQNPSKCKEYISLLHTKLTNLVPKQEIKDEWEQIKTAIVDTTRDIIQTQGTPPRNELWDEECKKTIQEKNKARKKWLQMKTRISWNKYFNKRNQVNKICTQKEKKWLSN